MTLMNPKLYSMSLLFSVWFLYYLCFFFKFFLYFFHNLYCFVFISVYVMLLLAVLVTIGPSAFNKFGLVFG